MNHVLRDTTDCISDYNSEENGNFLNAKFKTVLIADQGVFGLRKTPLNVDRVPKPIEYLM
jgi:hypothetical protein